MEKFNFYKKKYEALETFYGWVDQDSEYDTAVEQSIYYNHSLEGIDEIIFNITIAVRFARCGKTVSEQFKRRLEKILLKYRSLHLEDYCMTDEEMQVFTEEVNEVEALILMI